MPDMIHNIVYQFAKQLREIYGDELKKVVVYGSYARGDYQKNSDVDIRIFSPEILGSCYNNIITDSINPSQRETYRHKSVGEKNERK